MKDESGSLDGSAAEQAGTFSFEKTDTRGCCGLEVDNQFLEVSSLCIRSRMSGSGTSAPEFINDSACSPGRYPSVRLPEIRLQHDSTKRSLFSDIVPQEVSRADSCQLRIPAHEPFTLRAFANARGTDQYYTGSFLEFSDSTGSPHYPQHSLREVGYLPFCESGADEGEGIGRARHMESTKAPNCGSSPHDAH